MAKKITRFEHEGSSYADVTEGGVTYTLKFDAPGSNSGVVVDSPRRGTVEPPTTIGPSRPKGKFAPDEDVDWEPDENQADPANVTYNLRGRKTGQVLGQATTRNPGVYPTPGSMEFGGRDPGEGRTGGWVGRKTEVVKDPSKKDYGHLESGWAALTEPLNLLDALGSKQASSEIAANMAAEQAKKDANKWTSAAVEYGPLIYSAGIKAPVQAFANLAIPKAKLAKAASEKAKEEALARITAKASLARSSADKEAKAILAKEAKLTGKADVQRATPLDRKAELDARGADWRANILSDFDLPQARAAQAQYTKEIADLSKSLKGDVLVGADRSRALKKLDKLEDKLADVKKEISKGEYNAPKEYVRLDEAQTFAHRLGAQSKAEEQALRAEAAAQRSAAEAATEHGELQAKDILADRAGDAAKAERDALSIAYAGAERKKGLLPMLGTALGGAAVATSMHLPGSAYAVRNTLKGLIGSSAAEQLSERKIKSIMKYAARNPRSPLGVVLKGATQSPGAYSKALERISPRREYAETLLGEDLVQALEDEGE